MDFSDREGDLLDRDDDVAEEGEDTEDNAGFNTGVASGEVTGGGNSVSSAGRNSVSPANGTGVGNRTSAGNPIIPHSSSHASHPKESTCCKSTCSIIFFRYDAIFNDEGRDREPAKKARKGGIRRKAKTRARRHTT